VRYYTLLLLVFVLTSCGQPLVMKTTPRATSSTKQTPQPTRAAPLGTLGQPETRPSTTAAATVAPATIQPATAPSPTPAVIILPRTPAPQTNEQHWRAQQLNRQSFNPPLQYVAQRGTPLFWYDPLTGQALEIGTLLGDFPVQAKFTFRGSNQRALEVPYQINSDFGLTSISDAVVQRMQEAGYSDRVEAYIVESDAVKPK
jgi:hypothetical protein